MNRYPCVIAVLLALCFPGAGAAEAADPLQEAELLAIQGNMVDAYRRAKQDMAEGTAAKDSARLRHANAVLGIVHYWLSEYTKSRLYLEEASRLSDEKAPDAVFARILHYRALLDIAVTDYDSAEKRLGTPALLQQASPSVQSTTQRLLATLAIRRGRLHQAEQLLAKAATLAQSAGDELAQAQAMGEQGLLDFLRGSYADAERRWTATLEYFERQGHHSLSALTLCSLAELQFTMGLVDESEAMYTRALGMFRGTANHLGEMRALLGLGKAARCRHAIPEAMGRASEALRLSRERHDYAGEASSLILLGDLWLSDPHPDYPAMPNPPNALKHYKAAQEIYRQAGDAVGELHAGYLAGTAYLAWPQYRVACRLFEHTGSVAEDIGERDVLWRSLRGEARALIALDELSEALNRYRKALIVLEQIYSSTEGLGGETRRAYLSDKRRFFEEHIELLLKLNTGTGQNTYAMEAFRISEASRSRQFIELLSRSSAAAVAGGDRRLEQLLQQEADLRYQLNRAGNGLQPEGADTSTSGTGRLSSRQELRHRLELLAEKIKAEYPSYAALMNPQPPSVDEIQSVLLDGEQVLSYFMLPDTLVVFFLRPGRFLMKTIAVDRLTVQDLVASLRLPFTNLGFQPDIEHWPLDSAHELYKLVFEPVAELAPEGSHVYIAADDVLYTLPFELLLCLPAAGKGLASEILFGEYAGFNWLGDSRVIAYLPSTSALHLLRRHKRQPAAWQEQLVGFGDPDFGEGDEGGAVRSVLAGSALDRATGITGLSRLPETADELRTAQQTMGGRSRLFLRREANEANVYRQDLSKTRFLMFSTHGLLAGDFVSLSEPALALSLVNNPSGYDGLLGMSEVLGLRLNADLVVLSACNTAGEPENARGGEGFAGLTRSFMYAGARSMLVSHWPVASQSTVGLMAHFYHALGAGRGKAEAIAAARRELMKETLQGVSLAHPFFWAPFVIVGEM